MTKANGNVQAQNTGKNENRNGARGIKGRVVALALAGVLAIGGVSAWCIAGVGKSPGQAPAAAQVATQQATASNATASKQVRAGKTAEPGMEVKLTREGAIDMACKRVGAGGQAKGEAKNVKTSDLITGGGTKYYVVDFDLGDVHYTVNVNVVEGTIISAEQSHGGVRQLLDENGNPQEGTQQPVD